MTSGYPIAPTVVYADIHPVMVSHAPAPLSGEHVAGIRRPGGAVTSDFMRIPGGAARPG